MHMPTRTLRSLSLAMTLSLACAPVSMAQDKPGPNPADKAAAGQEPAPTATTDDEKAALQEDEETSALEDGPITPGDGPGLLSLGAEPGDNAREAGKSRFQGFIQQETAYTYANPGHWSTAVVRAHVGTSGQFANGMKWKASVRGEFDPVHAWMDFYPDPVRNDQRVFGLIGETYVDTSFKGWDLRLGRQNIVWGEMVGLFFADVVTAKDLRHFILPSFDIVRIPQWAARAEYFFKESHLELIWIPYTSFDRIGKPGSEFYPFQVPAPNGFTNTFRDDQLPARSLANSNFGGRISTMIEGWDLSAFHYRSMDTNATFYRDVTLTGPSSGVITYTPRHDRISQTGGTLTKDLADAIVLKAEAVYTSGRSFNVTRIAQPNGVVQKDTIDYAVGLDFTLPADGRINTQFFQRHFFGHDRDMLQDSFESGFTFLYQRKFQQKWEAELLWIQSLNRWENLIRPRLTWRPEPNLRVSAGIDIFEGPVEGFLGRFANRDRLYVETRYDF
jgi:hypothetical protein